MGTEVKIKCTCDSCVCVNVCKLTKQVQERNSELEGFLSRAISMGTWPECLTEAVIKCKYFVQDEKRG
jgi:hypothetical protein